MHNTQKNLFVWVIKQSTLCVSLGPDLKIVAFYQCWALLKAQHPCGMDCKTITNISYQSRYQH